MNLSCGVLAKVKHGKPNYLGVILQMKFFVILTYYSQHSCFLFFCLFLHIVYISLIRLSLMIDDCKPDSWEFESPKLVMCKVISLFLITESIPIMTS